MKYKDIFAEIERLENSITAQKNQLEDIYKTLKRNLSNGGFVELSETTSGEPTLLISDGAMTISLSDNDVFLLNEFIMYYEINSRRKMDK